MVIKLRSIINKVISIGVCVLLSFSIYKKCSQESQAPCRIVVQSDSLLAEQTTSALSQFIKANTIPFESKEFQKAIFSQFPCIASYEIERNASGNLACIIQAVQPLIIINRTWVLAHNGQLASVNDFEPFSLKTVRTISMESFLVTDFFRASIAKLAPDLYQSFNVVWVNDQEAFLCDKSQPNFSIRFNADSIPQSSIVQQCAVLKNDLEARGVFATNSSKKKPQQWVADIRFKNQIVLSRNMEGARYG